MWCEGPSGIECKSCWVGLFSCFECCPQPSINTTNIDTLLVATDQTERIVEPPDNVQEKIAFIFNNLSQSNMTQKVKGTTCGLRLIYTLSLLKAAFSARWRS